MVWIFCGCNCVWLSCVSLCSVGHHGTPPPEAPGFLHDSPSGSNERVKPDLLLTSSKCFQMPLHPHHSSPLTAPVSSQNQGTPGLVTWALCSVCTISVGTMSASSVHPPLCRDENQVRTEEALQRLFFCSAEGAFVCVLQDKSQTQAEAGLKCIGRWLWVCGQLEELCCKIKLFGSRMSTALFTSLHKYQI